MTGSVRVKAASNLIVVRIDGAHFATETAPLIAKTGQLMLFDFENDLTGPSLDPNGNPIATPSLYNLLKQVQPQAQKGSPEGYYLFHAKTVTTKPKKGAKSTTTVKQSLDKRGAAPTLKQLLTPVGGKVPPDSQVLKVPANMIVVRCAGASGCIGATSPAGTYYYLMKYFPDRGGEKGPIPEMTGTDLVLSGTRADFGQGGSPVVLLQFTNHGSKQFAKITKQEAARGALRYNRAGRRGDYLNYVQHFAIVLDGQLKSTPYIDFKRNPNGIPGSYAEIDLGQGGTIKEAKDLALVLQTGALPIQLVLVARRVVH